MGTLLGTYSREETTLLHREGREKTYPKSFTHPGNLDFDVNYLRRGDKSSKQQSSFIMLEGYKHHLNRLTKEIGVEGEFNYRLRAFIRGLL